MESRGQYWLSTKTPFYYEQSRLTDKTIPLVDLSRLHRKKFDLRSDAPKLLLNLITKDEKAKWHITVQKGNQRRRKRRKNTEYVNKRRSTSVN